MKKEGEMNMWQRKQKKSEDAIARIKNTDPAVKHIDKKAEEWMKRKPYEGVWKHEQDTKQKITDKE